MEEEERLLIKQIKKAKRHINMYTLFKVLSSTLGIFASVFCGVSIGQLIQGNYFFGDSKANIIGAILLAIISLLSSLTSIPYWELRSLLTQREEKELTNDLNKVRKNI